MLEKWGEDKSPITSCFRSFYKTDGQKLLVSEKDENEFRHVDTSCYLINRVSFDILDIWLKTPKKLSAIGDRIFFAAIKWKGYKMSFTKKRTVAYRSRLNVHYKNEDLKNLDLKSPDEMKKSFAYLLTKEGRFDCINSIKFWPKIYL